MGSHVEHCTAYFGMKSLSSWQFSPWSVSYLCETLTCCSFDIQYSFSVKSCFFSFSPLHASLWLSFHEEMMLLKDFKFQIIFSFFLKEIWGNKHSTVVLCRVSLSSGALYCHDLPDFLQHLFQCLFFEVVLWVKFRPCLVLFLHSKENHIPCICYSHHSMCLKLSADFMSWQNEW